MRICYTTCRLFPSKILGYLIPETPEIFVYDADGNLTQDGLWHYAYNTRNQLIAMDSKYAMKVDGVSILVSISMTYDYLGCMARRVTDYETGDYKVERYIYNGTQAFAVLHSYNDIPAGVTTYTWGLESCFGSIRFGGNS